MSLVLIDGGLRPGESVLDKLRHRPEDFPEGVFARLLGEHEAKIPMVEVVSILRRRRASEEIARQASTQA